MRARWIIFLFITVIAGLWAFATGRDMASMRADELAVSIQGLSNENLRLRDEIAGLQSFARESNRRLSTPSDRAEPSDMFERSALDLLRARRQAGVSQDRLTDVIAATSPVRSCNENAETAQFIVKTEFSRSDFNSVSLSENRVVARATGTASRDSTGQAHSWYDWTLPVRVDFTHISGTTSTASGVLPFQHSMIVGDVEYRFLLAAGDTSFISITADTCKFP
jgi:hypothetical protein